MVRLDVVREVEVNERVASAAPASSRALSAGERGAQLRGDAAPGATQEQPAERPKAPAKRSAKQGAKGSKRSARRRPADDISPKAEPAAKPRSESGTPTTVPKDASPGASPKPAATKPARKNVQVAAGKVRSLAHGGSGTAAVVALAAGGRVLTLTDFDIDPGPKVVVRLVAGPSPEGRDFVTLGDLKGNKGDQQYTVPKGTDLTRYSRVVFGCVPFSQALAEARLAPS